MKMQSTEHDEGSPLSELAAKSGWHKLEPPTEEQDWSDANIIGNYKGRPIKVGFQIEKVEDTDDCLHKVYRTSKYDVHLKIESLGAGLAQGQVKVKEADGYEKDQNC